MKVRELLELIKKSKKEYKDFLDWDVALEQIRYPTKNINTKTDIIKYLDLDGTNCMFIKSHCISCCTYFTKNKVFGIQITY